MSVLDLVPKESPKSRATRLAVNESSNISIRSVSHQKYLTILFFNLLLFLLTLSSQLNLISNVGQY